MSELRHVTIYTDGACTGNPGPGGYGTVLLYEGKRREMSGGFRRTTNNRMEMMAAIAGLRELRYPCRVTLYTDSQYLTNSIMKGWARSWRANGWKRKTGDPALNVDLWEELLRLCETHTVTVQWIRGHAGDTENELCDALSVGAARGSDLAVDEVYERTERRPQPWRPPGAGR